MTISLREIYVNNKLKNIKLLVSLKNTCTVRKDLENFDINPMDAEVVNFDSSCCYVTTILYTNLHYYIYCTRSSYTYIAKSLNLF
jgi:hypothetical protein